MKKQVRLVIDEGKKTLRELWPKIVDGYFHALCNPKRKT